MKNIIKIVEMMRGGLQGLMDEPITLRNEPYMPLHIEYIGPGPDNHPAIAVSHTYEQNGDLMRDPEICFQWGELADPEAPEKKNITLYPYTYRNDGLGINQEYRYQTEDGKVMANVGQIRGVEKLCRMWDRNISAQGFILCARREYEQDPRNAGRVMEDAMLYQADLFGLENPAPATPAGAALDPNGVEVPVATKEFVYKKEEQLIEVATGKQIPIDQLKFQGKEIHHLTNRERVQFLKDYRLQGYDGNGAVSAALTLAAKRFDPKEWAEMGMDVVEQSASEYPAIEAMPLPEKVRQAVLECYGSAGAESLGNHAYWLESRKKNAQDLYSIADAKSFSSQQAKKAVAALEKYGYQPSGVKKQGDVYAILLKKAPAKQINTMGLAEVQNKAGEKFYALYHVGDVENANLNFQMMDFEIKPREVKHEEVVEVEEPVKTNEAAEAAPAEVDEFPLQDNAWSNDEDWALFHAAITKFSAEIPVEQLDGKRLGAVSFEDWKNDHVRYMMKFPPTKEVYEAAVAKNKHYLTQHTHPEVLYLNDQNFRRMMIRDLFRGMNKAVVEKLKLQPWEMTLEEFKAVNDFGLDEFKARVSHALMLEKAHSEGKQVSEAAINSQFFTTVTAEQEKLNLKEKLDNHYRWTPYHQEVCYMTQKELEPFHKREQEQMDRYNSKGRKRGKKSATKKVKAEPAAEIVKAPETAEIPKGWAFEPANMVQIPGQFEGVIQSVDDRGVVCVRLTYIGNTEKYQLGEVFFAPGGIDLDKTMDKVYRREDLKPLAETTKLEDLAEVPMGEAVTPSEKSAAVYRHVLQNFQPKEPAINPEQWQKEMKRHIKNPDYFRAIEEAENELGLKIGDIVKAVTTEGRPYGYIVNIVDNKEGDENTRPGIEYSVLIPGCYNVFAEKADLHLVSALEKAEARGEQKAQASEKLAGQDVLLEAKKEGERYSEAHERITTELDKLYDQRNLKEAEIVRLKLQDEIQRHIDASKALAKKITPELAAQHAAEFFKERISGEPTAKAIGKVLEAGQPMTPLACLRSGYACKNGVEVALTDGRTFTFKAADIALVAAGQVVMMPAPVSVYDPAVTARSMDAAIKHLKPAQQVVDAALAQDGKKIERGFRQPDQPPAGPAVNDFSPKAEAERAEMLQAAIEAGEKGQTWKDNIWERGGVWYEILPPATHGNPGEKWEAGTRYNALLVRYSQHGSRGEAVEWLKKQEPQEVIKDYEAWRAEIQAQKTRVENKHLMEQVKGLEDLEAKYKELQGKVTDILTAGGEEFPAEAKPNIFMALNSEEGVKVITKYHDNAGVIAYAGAALAYQDDPEMLKKLQLPPEIVKAVVELTAAPEQKKRSAEKEI